MMIREDNFDVIVIGGGHAGIEAAIAAAKLGAKTALFTIVVDAIGNMPCNPSIGGTAKGHLVREIDALGGVMGIMADETFIQSRMLNRAKGPAVHSLRVQSDRELYRNCAKHTVEQCENLFIIGQEVVKLLFSGDTVCGVVTKLGVEYGAKAVVLACGTYLGGKIFIGDSAYSGGPDGMSASELLVSDLKKRGLKLRRFKTGTPARVHSRSIDYHLLELQEGDMPITPFSLLNHDKEFTNKVNCHIAYTNERTHNIIRENLHRSPLYGGEIEGVGPRYCPSIEDKVVRFSDKPRHQLFIEPCGLDTEEVYLQGVSSSLPLDVQQKMYQSIVGLSRVEIIRPAYAIEYDCVDPTTLRPTLEFKDFPALFGAGQFNGSSGYEEAAAQGLVAGINAAFKVLGKDEFVLTRQESYIGTLIDDLVTKGCSDPYRMMTSRSEYRLILRQDNADLRLTERGREIGLVDDERYRLFCLFRDNCQKLRAKISKVTIKKSEKLDNLLVQKGSAEMKTAATFETMLKRPQISFDELSQFCDEEFDYNRYVRAQVETEVKYEGYIKRQKAQAKTAAALENKSLQAISDYCDVSGLRLEAVEKLNRIKPQNLGQASRISGVSPSDITVLIIYLDKRVDSGEDAE